jgi:hypothetical protein
MMKMASTIEMLHINGNFLFRLYKVDLRALRQRFQNIPTIIKQVVSVIDPSRSPDFGFLQKRTICPTSHGTQFK